MEIAAGGELYDYLSERKCLEEVEAKRIFRQIATAVYYCHKNNICHRDLKLENILLDENGNAKVSASFCIFLHKNFHYDRHTCLENINKELSLKFHSMFISPYFQKKSKK